MDTRMSTARRIDPFQSGNESPRWQQHWREAISDPHELLHILGLEAHAVGLLAPGDTGFAMRVPRGFAARMRHGDPADPLLLQVLPGSAELRVTPGYSEDAVGDLEAIAVPGVLHKYAGRALLITTGACAINCRYCFRRHFPYAEENASSAQWQEAVNYLASDPSISEVILSGGDPLSLATAKLASLTDALVRLPHIRRLRIHSRLPIVLPERIDSELLRWLAGLPLQKVLVLHANHPNEIDETVALACRELAGAGVTLLNQSVLLRRINDSVEALTGLSERLFDCGVLPYYLHQLDRVSGAAHFEVADPIARELLESLRVRLPGYLVPRLVRESAGATSKRPV